LNKERFIAFSDGVIARMVATDRDVAACVAIAGPINAQVY
jgi:hypothetical protein